MVAEDQAWGTVGPVAIEQPTDVTGRWLQHPTRLLGGQLAGEHEVENSEALLIACRHHDRPPQAGRLTKSLISRH